MPYSPKIKYKDDGFLSRTSKNVLPIMYKCPSQKTRQAIFFESEFIYQKSKLFGISLFLNNIAEIGAQLRNLYANFLDCNPLVATYNHYTIHPTLPYIMEAYTSLRMLGILGNYLSDMVIFNTQYHYSMFKDNVHEFMMDPYIPAIEKKLAYVPIPVLDNEMKPHYENKKDPWTYDPDKIIFYYNHRLQSYKQWQVTFDMLKRLWDEGHKNFEVHLSYMSGDNVDIALSKYPFIKIFNTHTHDEYYKNLVQPHFNTFNSLHETFCISMMESGLLGGIPIIPKTMTFPELYPEDYPFFFDSPETQEAIIRNILTKGYRTEYLSEVKNKLREHLAQYNSHDVGKLMSKTLHDAYWKICNKNYQMIKDKRKLHREIKKHKGKEMLFVDFYRAMKKALGFGNQALPPWRMTFLLERFPHKKYFKRKQLYIMIE